MYHDVIVLKTYIILTFFFYVVPLWQIQGCDDIYPNDYYCRFLNDREHLGLGCLNISLCWLHIMPVSFRFFMLTCYNTRKIEGSEKKRRHQHWQHYTGVRISTTGTHQWSYLALYLLWSDTDPMDQMISCPDCSPPSCLRRLKHHRSNGM